MLIAGGPDQEPIHHRLKNIGMHHNLFATTPGYNILELGSLWFLGVDGSVDGYAALVEDGDRLYQQGAPEQVMEFVRFYMRM